MVVAPSRVRLEALAQEVLGEIAKGLTARNSSLVHEGVLSVGIEAQVRSILAETIAALHLGIEVSSFVSYDYDDIEALTTKGTVLAMRGFDPAEPLIVGEMLFSIGLPKLAELFPDVDPIQLANRLHHAIWRRFPPGAIGYVEMLRKQLIESEIAANERIARELHDRIAHGIVAGIQQIEISKLHGGGNDAIDRAEKLLRDTLENTRRLAQDMRLTSVGRSLTGAVGNFVARADVQGPVLSYRVIGTPLVLTDLVVAEVFAVVLEACRNARSHATGASMVEITLEWTESALVVSVVDDGAGNEHGQAAVDGLGITGMRERANRIGGGLEMVSRSPGTAVILTLPHHEVAG